MKNAKNIKACITAIGGYVPEDILTNEMLEKMVDTNDEWIVSRTGIKERRILKDPKKPTSYMGIKASNKVIEERNIDPMSIDLVITATVTPDLPVASTAAYIATEIGAKNAFSFDIQAACSGFLYGMSVAKSFIESGRYQRVLLVGADKMSSIVDYTDRATCILFGDGAGAALFEASENEFGYEDEFLQTDGNGRNYLKIDAGGSLFPPSHETLDKKMHNLYQEGQVVFKYAVSNMLEATQKIMERNNLKGNDINYLVPHQANKRIIDSIASKTDIDSDKILMNIERYGNTTAATIPLLLNDNKASFKKGEKFIFIAFGGGFSWGASYLTWSI